MTISHRQACDRFWELAGFDEPFPRSLETAIAMAVPLTVIRLPRLRPSSVCEWLKRNGVEWSLDVRDRPLNGCLVAHKGNGLIFLDGGMPADEARFTVAHELAHFILHYLWPRQVALSRCGDEMTAVLDGERLPTPAERLSGILQGVQIGPCNHLLDRTDGGGLSAEISRTEAEADLCAFELLAPVRAVLASSTAADRELVLQRKFGLPVWAAKAWARLINGKVGEGGLIAGLRAAARKN